MVHWPEVRVGGVISEIGGECPGMPSDFLYWKLFLRRCSRARIITGLCRSHMTYPNLARSKIMF